MIFTDTDHYVNTLSTIKKEKKTIKPAYFVTAILVLFS